MGRRIYARPVSDELADDLLAVAFAAGAVVLTWRWLGLLVELLT